MVYACHQPNAVWQLPVHSAAVAGQLLSCGVNMLLDMWPNSHGLNHYNETMLITVCSLQFQSIINGAKPDGLVGWSTDLAY